MDARAGFQLIDPGNFVQTSDTSGLFILNTVRPISVSFSIPEDALPLILNQQQRKKDMNIEVYDRTQEHLLDKGNTFIIDNQIDLSTGTVKIRASFPNDEDKLFPNQFVNVRMQTDTLDNATVLPTRAVQHGANGTFVFRLNEHNTVNVIPVSIRATTGERTAIAGALLPRERVVVEGADKLTEGAKVTVIDATHAKETPSRGKPI
jgi:multidrug efflux system membrane fusion protein